jgi:hypothetical protein
MTLPQWVQFTIVTFCFAGQVEFAAAQDKSGPLLAQDFKPRKKILKTKSKPSTPKPPVDNPSKADAAGAQPTSVDWNYVALRSIIGISYSPNIAKVTKREAELAFSYGQFSGTSTSETSSSKTTVGGPLVSGQVVIPVSTFRIAPIFSYAPFSGDTKRTTTDPDTNEEKEFTLKANATNMNIGVGASVSPTNLFDIVFSLTQSSDSVTVKGEGYKSTTSYSYLQTGLGIGAHSKDFEASVAFIPGATVKGKSKVTINDEEQTSSKKPEKEIPTSMNLQGRYMIIPNFFAGASYSSGSAPHGKNSEIAIEGGYLLPIVQLSVSINSGDESTTEEDTDSSETEKSLQFATSADFRSGERQTYSLGVSSENSTTTSSPDSGGTGKSSVLTMIFSGKLAF